MRICALLFCCLHGVWLWAQEAGSGFDLRATVSAEGDYTHQLGEHNEGPLSGGGRVMVYPTLKLSNHWSIQAVAEAHSTPYSYDEFATAGHRLKTNLLEANATYFRFWHGGSVTIRVGQMSTAFGSFLLRYDDAVNPLIDVPPAYGYYYKPVSYLGVFGSEVEVTRGRLDMRAQFVNSSPANPRGLLSRDQYGNWAGGAGYTIRQGLRAGISAYRGPYLDRHYDFYFPGEANPVDLPATALGLDVQWGSGPWNVYGEWQHFRMDYHAIPTFRERTGYVEARRVLTPRWYLATRVGYLRTSAVPGRQSYELAAGFRPNRYQLAKIGYEIQQGPEYRGTLGNTFSLQLVTSFQALSVARN